MVLLLKFPSLVAEALAVRSACLLGAVRGLAGLPICSDSKEVISLASSNLDPPWEINVIIQDIRSLAHPSGFKFIHAPRNFNKVAHCI